MERKLSAEKLLLYEPLLLQWHLDHGVAIKKVYHTIDYQSTKIFTWFVDQVREALYPGDTDKSKSLLADVFRLLGYSAYEMI